jgi:hypothetical protein
MGSLAHLQFGLMIVGVGLIAVGLYQFRKHGAEPEAITVFELMQDPYANPVRGRYVALEGKIIGKANSGSTFGEDVTMQDTSGCLIYLNYESMVPLFGNLIAGMGWVRQLIDKPAKAVGWFRRSSFQIVDLEYIESEGVRKNSYTRLWAVILGCLLLVVSVLSLCFMRV